MSKQQHQKERGCDRGNILQLMFDSSLSSNFSWILFQSSVNYEFAIRRYLPFEFDPLTVCHKPSKL